MKANQKTRNLSGETAGAMDPADIVILVIAALIAAASLPIALGAVFDANTTGWDAGAVAMWSIFGVIIIAVVILGFSRGITGRGGT